MEIVNKNALLLTALCYFFIFIPSSSVEVEKNVCTVPPQPENGYQQLYTLQCLLQQSNCKVQEGTKLPAFSYLVYTCKPGYKLSGPDYVFCDDKGNWSVIPVCTEIRCESLTSASTEADCKLNGQRVSCETSVLPGTTAKLNCRDNYQKVGNFQSKQVDQVMCNNTGQWEPEPMQCLSSTPFTNIVLKNGTITVNINIERNNSFCTLLESLPDKIIIHTKACKWNYSISMLDEFNFCIFLLVYFFYIFNVIVIPKNMDDRHG